MKHLIFRKLHFLPSNDVLQTHFVSKFRFEALKGLFLTDINFSPFFTVSKKSLGQLYFRSIFEKEAFLRRKKIVSNGCLRQNCSQTSFSKLRKPKKTKSYRFALKPSKLPEGPAGRHLRECFRTMVEIKATVLTREKTCFQWTYSPGTDACVVTNRELCFS